MNKRYDLGPMAPSDPPLFINYSPTGKLSRQDRYRVAQHISKHHRNRSKPNLKNRAGQFFVGEGDSASWISQDGHEAGRHQRATAGAGAPGSGGFIATGDNPEVQRGGLSDHSLSHDGHGTWSDPFGSLPVKTRGDVGQIVQFCEAYLPMSYLNLRCQIASAATLTRLSHQRLCSIQIHGTNQFTSQ
jgi:hypothetical protein